MSASSPKTAARKRKAATAAEPATVKSIKTADPLNFKGSFGCALDDSVKPHTLILGTQPGDVSLEAGRYYDTHTNAMWHIVGDAIGFRRGWLDGNGRGPPASITRSLRHAHVVESYTEALGLLTSRGYALWDVLAESERAGSLDGDIKNAKPADVRGLVEAHPSIERICLASGATTGNFFKKHFKGWLAEPGAFVLHDNRPTQQIFGKLVAAAPAADAAAARPPIEIVVMESVSPAFVPRVSYGGDHADKRVAAYHEAGYARLSKRASAYAWKRQQWFDACFARELSVAERAKTFGDRPGDFHEDEEQADSTTGA